MYKEDFKPFTDVLMPKNILLQVAKATILPANLVMNDFNQLIIEAEKNKQKVPDFDWKASISKHFATWPDNVTRFFTCSLIKKTLEEIALFNCSARIVDKLTKDTLKSLRRKYVKFGNFTACQKIFQTYLWSNVLTSAAMFLYDIVQTTSKHMYDIYSENKYNSALVVKKGRKRYVQPLRAAYFLVNRVGFYGLTLTCASLGYSSGAYFNHAYGGMVGAVLFELGASVGFNVLLPL